MTESPNMTNRFSIHILTGQSHEHMDSVLYFNSPAEVEKELLKLFERKRISVAKNPKGEIIGRVNADGKRIDYWFEPF